jgi:hypothetical protein
MIVIDMSKSHILLDLITSKSYPYINMGLTKDEYYELEDFVKHNCFIISNDEREDKWEYRHEIEFLYKGKTLLLKHFKSYTVDDEYFLLRCEK